MMQDEETSRGVDTQYAAPLATASKNEVVPSYDDRQAAAVRVVCVVCRRAFDMTTPAERCVECR